MVVVGCCKGEERLGGIFHLRIQDVFACSPTTKGAMAKWRSRLDLSRQIGLKTPLTHLLIVVEDWFTGG